MADMFYRLCTIPAKNEPYVERIDAPYKDHVQDTWLSFFETQEDIENAETSDDLMEQYAPLAPLLTTIYKNTSADHHKRTKGAKNSPRKTALLAEAFSLDEFDEHGTPWSDIIEDHQSELPFRHIEDLNLVASDPRLQNLSSKQQAALKRFIMAWALHDAGHTLPQRVHKRLNEDRTLLGLPLALNKGRREVVGSKERNIVYASASS